MAELSDLIPHWDHWYEVVEGSSLRQGDILRDVRVYVLPEDLPLETPEKDRPEDVKVEHDRGDWIVMSASCDVVRDPTSYPWVLLGQVLPATEERLQVTSPKEFRKRIEILRRGLFPTFFLLANHDRIDPVFLLSFVQFRGHFTLPSAYLGRAVVGRQRLRLKSPFREMFGNWVGENFSRVGVEDGMNLPRGNGMSPSALLRMAEEED